MMNSLTFQLGWRITAGPVVVSSQGADGFPGPVGAPGEKGKKVTENITNTKGPNCHKDTLSVQTNKYVNVHSCEYDVFLRVHQVLQGPRVRGDP